MPHPLTIRLDERTINKLDSLALATDRKRSWHMVRAIESYIQEEEEFLAGVEDGIKAIKAGETVNHYDLIKTLNAITNKT